MFASEHSHILPENALEYPLQHFFFIFWMGEQCENKMKIADATLRTIMVNRSRSHTLEHNSIAFFHG